ncbi:MAG TPA: hypothetical protein VGP89_18185 [Candidatus Angelobacter sp.]|nr:hypothetical protein [Candidatus Angelobacter sp.]
MNRNEATKIAASMLKEGQVYHFNSRALGRANLQFIGGTKFKIVGGFLQSQSTKKKFPEGAEITLPGGIGEFYELPDIGEVAE